MIEHIISLQMIPKIEGLEVYLHMKHKTDLSKSASDMKWLTTYFENAGMDN